MNPSVVRFKPNGSSIPISYLTKAPSRHIVQEFRHDACPHSHGQESSRASTQCFYQIKLRSILSPSSKRRALLAKSRSCQSKQDKASPSQPNSDILLYSNCLPIRRRQFGVIAESVSQIRRQQRQKVLKGYSTNRNIKKKRKKRKKTCRIKSWESTNQNQYIDIHKTKRRTQRKPIGMVISCNFVKEKKSDLALGRSV
jgi:hypothetical protein